MDATAPKTAPAGTILGHPTGLFVLFFTEMWERFSYYGMRAILLLFLIDKINGGMGLNEAEGGAIYGIYTASVYLLSLPGGWIADNLLGQRKSIWYGGIIIMLGHIILAFPAGTALRRRRAAPALSTRIRRPRAHSAAEVPCSPTPTAGEAGPCPAGPTQARVRIPSSA